MKLLLLALLLILSGSGKDVNDGAHGHVDRAYQVGEPGAAATHAGPLGRSAHGSPDASVRSLGAVGAIAQPIIGGRATWYSAHGMIGAAGPALRHYLGRHWRGTLVTVCHVGKSDTFRRCVVIKLTDWCRCPRRLLDLSDDAFAQLAPLSKGVIDVAITRAVRVPDPPATDTAP